MRDFLVGVAVLHEWRLAPGHGDDRGAREVGILQARSQIGRADGLREADSGPSGDAGIAVGHVGDGLFAVPQDALHADELSIPQLFRRLSVSSWVVLSGAVAGAFGLGTALGRAF